MKGQTPNSTEHFASKPPLTEFLSAVGCTPPFTNEEASELKAEATCPRTQNGGTRRPRALLPTSLRFF